MARTAKAKKHSPARQATIRKMLATRARTNAAKAATARIDPINPPQSYAQGWETRRAAAGGQQETIGQQAGRGRKTRRARGRNRRQQAGNSNLPAVQAQPITRTDHALATRLAQMARTDLDQGIAMIERTITSARTHGSDLAHNRFTNQGANFMDAVSEAIVTGFVAEVNQQLLAFGGRLPPGQCWTINPLTLNKVVNALGQAGYTPEGRQDITQQTSGQQLS